jgi:ribosomal protein S27AE
LGDDRKADLKVGLHQTTPDTRVDAHGNAPVEADLQVGLSIDSDDTTCPRCGESHDLAKVKGCIKCLKCGYKFDCNGW